MRSEVGTDASTLTPIPTTPGFEIRQHFMKTYLNLTLTLAICETKHLTLTLTIPLTLTPN